MKNWKYINGAEVGNRLDWSENLVGKEVWVKSGRHEWKCYVMQDKGDKVYIRHDSDGSQGWVSKERISGKVNNSKVGNAKDKNGKDLRVGDIVLVWTSSGERAGKVKEVSGDRITVAIRNEGDWSTPGKLANKVSNSKTGNGLWNASRTIYGKWNEKDSRPSDEYARLTWLGEGKGGLVNIWKGQSMTSEKFGSTDRKELERWAEQRIGNSSSDEEYWKKQYIETARKKGVPENKIQEFIKKIEKEGVKGVMTPTKKTGNGLARARNAMAGNWNSERNISPVGAYKEFIANLKNAIELGVAAVTYNIDGSTLKTWVEQAKKEGYGSHISGVQGQKVILK